MRNSFLLVSAVVLSACFAANAGPAWQYGRIVDVRKSVTSRTKTWVVNTPITEDATTYTIWVHLQNQLLTGNYELSSADSAPPDEWTTKYPVQVQVQGDSMYVRGPTGEVRLHIIHRKAARAMVPLTADEKKRLVEMENSAPQQSMIGFSQESKSADKPTSAQPAPAEASTSVPTPPPNAGTVTVRSTPYLSEVFVDGESMGYTPAKISLPPGKHSFRVEKPGYRPWTKNLTLTVGSELTLDASLEKK